MKLRPGDDGVEILFAPEEAGVLDQLVRQLTMLLQSHSSAPLDADPLFASLEVGGTDELPADPALARLLPDAFADEAEASAFRRLTEQGLVNRKVQDALRVLAAIGDEPGESPATFDATAAGVDDGAAAHDDDFDSGPPVAVSITAESMPAWARTLTSLRLAMAARIGLEREADYDRLIDDESTRGTVLIYDWIGALLEAVLALGSMSEAGPGDPDDPHGDSPDVNEG